MYMCKVMHHLEKLHKFEPLWKWKEWKPMKHQRGFFIKHFEEKKMMFIHFANYKMSYTLQPMLK